METIHVVNVSTDQVPHGSRIVVRVDNADDDDDHPRGLIRGADGIPVARVITRAVYAGQPATHGRSTSSMKRGIGDACTRASCPDRLLDDPTVRVEMSPAIEIETGTLAAWIDRDDPVRAALALDALSEETRCAVTPRHGPPKRRGRILARAHQHGLPDAAAQLATPTRQTNPATTYRIVVAGESRPADRGAIDTHLAKLATKLPVLTIVPAGQSAGDAAIAWAEANAHRVAY